MTDRNEPIRHTCPDIDYVKREIADMLRSMKNAKSCETLEEVLDYFSDWESTLNSIGVGNSCLLEDLRNSNSTLRTWGNDLVSDCEELEKEREYDIKERDAKIEELEDKIDELESELEEMKELV